MYELRSSPLGSWPTAAEDPIPTDPFHPPPPYSPPSALCVMPRGQMNVEQQQRERECKNPFAANSLALSGLFFYQRWNPSGT